ncbi:hypothetical protein Droror1_Dr00028034, partial [Drosera rotundifolia]
GADWGKSRGSCAEETSPLRTLTGPLYNSRGINIIMTILTRMRSPVYFLDISLLSQLRPDAHPQHYASPVHVGRSDCTYWCLSGVPNAWNQLLYTAL